MPASETFWRNLKTMHVVFAFSSVALAGVTFWMLADDFASEWRGHQQTVDKLIAMKQRAKLDDLTTDDYRAQLASLNRRIEDAQTDAAARQQEIDKQQAVVDTAALRFNQAEREVRTKRAERDKARADYDLAVRDGLPAATLADLYDKFAARQQAVDVQEKVVQSLGDELDREEAKLDEVKGRAAELIAEKKSLQFEVTQVESAIAAIEPDSWFSSAKRQMLDLPIIDGFSSVHKIQLDWLPELHIKLGMAETARFDRCRTCHISIDKVEAGNVPTFPHGEVESDDLQDWVDANKFPHPYASHPNLDLYLTAASPHPLQTFGCTICHEGQGSATNFNNAQHGPNNPYEEAEWEEEYGHHYNHFWEYPMLPERFREASCLKCHHDVVELGINPEFGASAPKVHRGFQLIQKYGCFGCHEIHGFSGEESIGPDLRLEPNFNAAALQLLHLLPAADSGAEENGDRKAVEEIRRLAGEVAADPIDAVEPRNRLQALIAADSRSPSPLLSNAVHGMAEAFKDIDVPGNYRKVGPSLRHIDEKTTAAWVEHWVEEPKRFRPTTTMPQFFHLSNQQDPHAENLMPVELTAIAQYLSDKSQPFDDQILQPADDYEPNAERGKKLFSRRGCLACHSHKDFPDTSADFGPDLSRVHAKIRPGEEGFHWLYTWLRDPQRYHPRTKMPNLFLEPQTSGETTVDPAADIAAYLLQGGPGEYERYQPQSYLGLDVEEMEGRAAGVRIVRVMPLSPASRAADAEGKPAPVSFGDVLRKYDGQAVSGAEQLQSLVDATPLGQQVTLEIVRAGRATRHTVVIADPLDDLVRLYLIKALGIEPAENVLKTRKYPGDPAGIKGDEIELVAPGGAESIDNAQWHRMKLNYVGRRTISQYGCYGCHDIPGFEQARPIGTTLQDWGRKDTSKLALEHIEEYLHHHGEPDGSSTHDRVVDALKSARAGGVEAGEFDSEEEADRELSAAAMYENLLHHRREGFLWQKLRQPRSYDYRKTETKGYDERLRMPKFPLSEEEIEAISTFVLGLVAEPPSEQYIYQPEGAARARIDGEFLLDKYNCTGCHMLDLPKAAFALEASDPAHPLRDVVGWTADELAAWFVENRDKLLSGAIPLEEMPEDVQRMQRLGAPLEEIVQLTNDPSIPAGDEAGQRKLTASVRTWMADHPHYMLAADLKPTEGEFPEGIARLLALKPPVQAIAERTREDGNAIINFHGLLMTPPDPEEDPEYQAFNYRSWDVLDVGGRILLPNYNMTAFRPRLEPDLMKPARGGSFAEWLVEDLASDRSSKASNDRGWAWSMAPPPLYLEGMKVQTPWLYEFLKNPQVIRHEAVLRMPRFNLDDAEARALANYFPAVDGSAFPYQNVPQRQPPYLERKNERLDGMIPDDSDYLSESWKLLNANLCMGCHSVGGKEFVAGPDPRKVTHGPDLNHVHDRLRPEWLAVWLSKPMWITPYTKMVVPKAEPSLLDGDAPVQSEALRDALLNYPRLIERDGAIFYDPKTKTVKPASEAVAAPLE